MHPWSAKPVLRSSTISSFSNCGLGHVVVIPISLFTGSFTVTGEQRVERIGALASHSTDNRCTFSNIVIRPLCGISRCREIEVSITVIGFIGVQDWAVIQRCQTEWQQYLSARKDNAQPVNCFSRTGTNWILTTFLHSHKGVRTNTKTSNCSIDTAMWLRQNGKEQPFNPSWFSRYA